MTSPRGDDPMNANDTPAPAAKVLIWDAPVRVFHWLLVLGFAGAWLTAESERWRQVHVTLGYTVGGLVLWRLLWGLVGSRHARFADFVRGPRAVWAHLQGLLRGEPGAHAGHNPLGALAIVALLGLALATVATGWANYSDIGGDGIEEAHEALATLMLAVVGVHLAGVALGSVLGGENLVRAMLSGRKRAAPAEAITRPRRALAALMLVAVLGFWAWQWQAAPAADTATMARHGADHDQDDDD